MNVIFAGTPDVAIPTLDALVKSHRVVGVITRPDAPIGRKRILTPSPVAERAVALDLDVLKTSHIDDDAVRWITERGADIGVVVAYGALVPVAALEAVPHGWLNLHFSALPTWRGAAPLQREIMSGSTEAHLTVFRLVEQLDAGDIFDQSTEPIGAHETAGAALSRLGVIGASRVLSVVESVAANNAVATPQVGPTTYAHKLTSVDGQLHSRQSVAEAYNTFRGVTPEPGAWVETTTGRLKILVCHPDRESRVASGHVGLVNGVPVIGFADGGLALENVQPAGKASMSGVDWVRGLRSQDEWTFA